MSTSKFKWLWSGLALIILAVAIASGPMANTQPVMAQSPYQSGHRLHHRHKPESDVYAGPPRPAISSCPDGNTMFMWGYSAGGGAFQHPGPVLCVNQGDTVTVILHNTLAEDVSIMFPGQENVLANGAPAQPQFSRPDADLADQRGAGQRRQRHLQLRGLQPGHLPLRERHESPRSRCTWDCSAR